MSYYPQATLSPGAVSGSSVVFTTNANVFTSDNVGQVIFGGGGIATITGYLNGYTVTCDITTPFLITVPNDPTGQCRPIPAYDWALYTPITQVTGLNHLQGLEVAILADGSVVPNQTVTELAPGVFGITLPQPACNVVVGLPYTCQVQTLYIDHPNSDQTVQTRRKNIYAVGVRSEFSRGLQVGADQPDASTQQDYAPVAWTHMNEIKTRGMNADAGNAEPLFTGDYYKLISSGWDVAGQIAIQQQYPLPAKILCLVAYWNQGDDR